MSYIVLIIYLQYHSNVHEGHKWDLDISLLSGNFVGEIHLFINSNDVSPQVQVDVFHFESLAYDEVSYSHACRQALFLIRIIIQKDAWIWVQKQQLGTGRGKSLYITNSSEDIKIRSTNLLPPVNVRELKFTKVCVSGKFKIVTQLKT